LCLASAVAVRSAIADHIATIITVAPQRVVEVLGFARTDQLEQFRSDHPYAAWPVVAAAVHAIEANRPVLTTHLGRYARMTLDALQL